jgi:hypothetical protein
MFRHPASPTRGAEMESALSAQDLLPGMEVELDHGCLTGLTGTVRQVSEESLLIELSQFGPGCYVRLSAASQVRFGTAQSHG